MRAVFGRCPYRTRAAAPGASVPSLAPRAGFRKAREQLLPTLVRHGATVGANATVVCGVTVGRHAFVAAGAVVVRDVADHALVAGNPGAPGTANYGRRALAMARQTRSGVVGISMSVTP